MSDSKVDLRKYVPSVEASLELCDEEAAEERLKRALDNPALDAAIGDLRKAEDEPEDETLRVRPKSPWEKKAEIETIERDALPSALAPSTVAAPPVTARIEPEALGARRRRFTPLQTVVGSIVLAFLPAMLVFVLFVKKQQGAEVMQNSAAPSGAASRIDVEGAPSASGARAAVTIEPAATAPAEDAGPAPTAGSSSGPAVGPVPPSHGRSRPRGAAEDPYDAAPPPIPTGAPAVSAPRAPATASSGPVPMFEREN